MTKESPELEISHSQLSLNSNGIIEIKCAANFEYDVKHINENYAEIKRLSKSKKALVLNLVGSHSGITKEAREYVASGPHKDFIKAEAFVLHSVAHKILANFYNKISKPIVQVGFFKNKADAEKWLLSLE